MNVQKAYERLEIPKIYHPFVTGAHYEKIRAFTNGTGVKVNIPPASVSENEISIAGDEDGVLKVKQAILQVSAQIPQSSEVNDCKHFLKI
jgi:hypothetical protein